MNIHLKWAIVKEILDGLREFLGFSALGLEGKLFLELGCKLDIDYCTS